MKERPILFSAPMVRALLAGTKTQTRRVMPHQPQEILPGYAPKVYWPARDRHMTHGDPDGAAYLQFERPGDYDGAHVMRGGFGFRCRYGQPGDRLWVREAWRPVHGGYPDQGARYRADFDRDQTVWRPSIHMPRWASRITLEVTRVRVERLQDISEADAVAEGVRPDRRCLPDDDAAAFSRIGKVRGNSFPIARYAALWESINGPGSWDANPWVWVVEFKRVG
jgi:hypothetical protein